MIVVFATVGTTSFDTLVSSLCSLPSLSTMARDATSTYCHLRHHQKIPSPSKHSLSSSPLASAPSSTSTLPVAVPSERSCSTSVRSYSSYPPSSYGHGDNLDEDDEAETLELVIQYGKGTCPLSFIPPSLKRTSERNDAQHKNDDSGSIMLMVPKRNNDDSRQQYQKLRVKWYRFQPSLLQDMERADIILCHAGAGTLLEALAIRRQQKQPPIINAVINSSLMNNHQLELAEELEKRKHIHVTRDCTSEWTTEEEAKQFWMKLAQFQPVPFAGRGGYSSSAQRGPSHVSSFQRIVDGVMSEANFDHNSWKPDADLAVIKKNS